MPTRPPILDVPVTWEQGVYGPGEGKPSGKWLARWNGHLFACAGETAHRDIRFISQVFLDGRGDDRLYCYTRSLERAMYFAERWAKAHHGKFREVVRDRPPWLGRKPKDEDSRS